MATASVIANPIFPWSAAYSVGILEIDTQHQGLIRLINDLHAAMAAGQGKEKLGKILEELVQYTERHFAYEEGLLRQKQYSKLAGHHAIHEGLTRQVKDLRERFRTGRVAMTLEVMKFLKNWLSDHILVHDMAYAAELKTLFPL